MSAEFRSGTAANTDAFFLAIDDLLVDNGWTQHDVINNSAGTYDIVYRSPAPLDADAGNYCYIRITRASSEQISFRTYCDWDATNHAGMFAAGSTGQTTMSGSSFNYWIRVNDWALATAAKISTSYYRGYHGFARRGLRASRAGMTKTTSGYSSGVNSMSVASDMTSKLKVGQKVTIINNAHNSASANKENAEVMEIASMTSNSITFTGNTTKAYDSGAVIGQNPIPALTIPLSTTGPFSTGFTGLWPNTGEISGVTSQQVSVQDIFPGNAEGLVDPSDGYSEYLGGCLGVSWGSNPRNGWAGYLYHWEICSHGSQSSEDVMDDGTDTFIVLYTSTYDYILGPM